MTTTDPQSEFAGGPPNTRGDSSHVLRQYVGIARRRWRWIIGGLVIGMVGGLISSYIGVTKPNTATFFKATNTVLYSDPFGNSSNLTQSAFLLQSADVQKGIAMKINLPQSELEPLVTAVARPDVSAIDITAISQDATLAVALADTSSLILTDYLVKAEKAQWNESRDAILQKLDDLKNQRADLEDQISKANTGDAAILRAQLDSVVNQYRTVYEQFQQLAANGEPASKYSILQPAQAIQINGRAYAARLSSNINSRGNAGASTFASKFTGSETDLTPPTSNSRLVRILVGGILGLFLGLATGFTVEIWDDRLRRRERVEEVTGLPVVAEVPVLSRDERQGNSIAVLDQPRSRTAERFRSIRTTILFALGDEFDIESESESESTSDNRAPVILVTSPSPGEGKTTTTTNVASAFADSGARVLVIDCDYRKPSIGNYLSPIADLVDEDKPWTTRIENLWFIPAPQNAGGPAETVAELRRLIEKWREEFDFVFLDTPPMLTTNDAVDILPSADRVLLVIRSGQTRSGPAERAASVLMRLAANVIGVSLNGCAAADMESYYGYYGYYYGYYGKGGGYYGKNGGYYGRGYNSGGYNSSSGGGYYSRGSYYSDPRTPAGEPAQIAESSSTTVTEP